MQKAVRKVADPYAETDVHYQVVGADTLSPDIIEVATSLEPQGQLLTST
jgi:hypothetical protein